MTPQAKLSKKLHKVGLPYHKINVFGAQIHITCGSLKTAQKWCSILKNFAQIKKIIETYVENKTNKDVNLPHMKKVYRVWATIR